MADKVYEKRAYRILIEELPANQASAIKVGKYARIDESLDTKFINKLFMDRINYVDWLTQRIIEYVNK